MAKGIYYCSFCGKSSKDVEKLIAGPSVFICDQCVTLCNYYIEHSPGEGQKILLDENGKAVLDADGHPQFIPTDGKVQ